MKFENEKLFKVKILCVGTETENSGNLKMQIYIFILKKPKIILKNLMKFALFLLGGSNITIKQANKWSFKSFLYFLCTAWKNVPKRVRRQKVCSF